MRLFTRFFWLVFWSAFLMMAAFVVLYYWDVKPEPKSIIRFIPTTFSKTVFPKGLTYYHTNLTIREDLIPTDSNFILVFEGQTKRPNVKTRNKYSNYTVVVGYVLKYRYRQANNRIDISEVSPILEIEHKKVHKLVKKYQFPEPINFW